MPKLTPWDMLDNVDGIYSLARKTSLRILRITEGGTDVTHEKEISAVLNSAETATIACCKVLEYMDAALDIIDKKNGDQK